MKSNSVSEISPQPEPWRKKAIVPQVGEVWVRTGPSDRWIIKAIYPKKIKNSWDTQKKIQTRILLCLEGSPKSTRDITLGTLKAWMNREDKHLELMRSTKEALHRNMIDQGMNEEQIKRMEGFFGLDERMPKPWKLKSVK